MQLYVIGERSCSEVASLTNSSESAVWQRIARGRKRLMSHLERFWKGENSDLRTVSASRTEPSSKASAAGLR
jgi:predicted DNA-binding protein YlxM (UPF0122 family)